jgi:hypothetical protein
MLVDSSICTIKLKEFMLFVIHIWIGTILVKLAQELNYGTSLLLPLPTKALKDIVFRFIIEYSGLRDFAPY